MAQEKDNHFMYLSFITTLILLGVFEYVVHYETVIPYSEDIVKIENNEDKILFAHYYGKSYASVNVTHPMLLEVDGEKKEYKLYLL